MYQQLDGEDDNTEHVDTAGTSYQQTCVSVTEDNSSSDKMADAETRPDTVDCERHDIQDKTDMLSDMAVSLVSALSTADRESEIK